MKRLPTGLYKRPNSKFYWTKIKGKRESTETSVLSLAKEVLEERKRKYLNLPPIQKKIQVEDYFPEFKAYYKTKTTQRNYNTVIPRIKLFLDNAKPYYLSDITFSKVQDFLIEIQKKVSIKTRNDYRQAISSFISYAIKKDYLVQNPVDKVEILKGEKRRPFYFTREQIRDMLKYSNGKPVHRMIMLGVYTGMRLGEMLDLKWESVDFDKQVIYVEKSKNKKFRAIPMHPHLKEYLEPSKSKGHVIVKNGGSPYKGKEAAKKGFDMLLEACDIKTPKGIRFHALRHSCASWLIMNGVDIYTVQSILGHSSVNMTQIYSHLSQDHLIDAIKKLKF